MSRMRLVPAVAVVALLAACQSSGPPRPVKSPNDERDYRHVVLPNNLRVLLIREPGSSLAAAAVSVARGSDHDPDAHPGLAHFVEHMLFIATGKYPEVDGFSEFVSRHGGDTNAYTDTDRTTYYFDVESEYLPEALDRFAQFFISPRFDPDYLEREKNAVQGEYQMQLKVDDWRGVAVDKRVVNPEHPGSRFDWGSLESLRGVGVAEAHAFFEANYSADTMTLAVLGSDDLDTLQKLVAGRFGAAVDRELGRRPVNPPLYDAATLPASYAWRTVAQTRTLTFRFPIPPVRPHYRTKPTVYIASLIGHEGPGSLHHVLSDRGWIQDLGAGGYDDDEWNATFGVGMTLTEDGNSHVAEIVDLTYAWIGLIRRQGVAAWRYLEEARRFELGFRFQEQTSPMNAVMVAAEALAEYPPEDVLRGVYLMDWFDERLIRRYLDFLTPENSLASISGPDIEGDRIEPDFGVSWRLGPGLVPREVEAPLKLPEPNPYLPEDLDLAFEPAAPEPPVTVDSGTAVETWHAPDTEFRTPSAYVNLDLRVAEPFGPDDRVLATLHAKLVEDAMNASAYQPSLAGLFLGVEATETGFRILVHGLHDKLPVLFDDVLTVFASTRVDTRKFAVARGELEREYANAKLARPYELLEEVLLELIHPQVWPVDTLADVARLATPSALTAWRRDRLAGMGATLFAHGNLRKDDARAFAALVHQKLGIVERPLELPKANRVDGSRRYEHAADHDDAAYALYIQGASDSIEERARIALIGHMLNAPYFTALRTQRQLGYVVQAYSNPIARRAGVVFVVQASKAGAAEIEVLTEEFLDDQRARFRGLSEAEFDEYKNGFVATVVWSDRNNSDRVSRLLGDLANGILTFDFDEQLVDAVNRLQPADVADAYEALIDPLRGNRLTVFSRGKPGTAPSDAEPIATIEAFKRQAGS